MPNLIRLPIMVIKDCLKLFYLVHHRLEMPLERRETPRLPASAGTFAFASPSESGYASPSLKMSAAGSPIWLATMISGTVDIPTASPPIP